MEEYSLDIGHDVRGPVEGIGRSRQPWARSTLESTLKPQVRGGRRKQIALWTCCVCGNAGMSMRVDTCSYCQTARCMYCPVSKIKR
ncbi:hypothetical protein BGZ63DRAFT_77667 [Mariannaea sp. PMI_226]|nr:hypothetical protein BGZ63DRAFT_77667 [Mariannaea sp. PMI_226]